MTRQATALNEPASSGDRTLDFAAMRAAMVVSQLRPNGVADVRVVEAMGRIPREQFVSPDRAVTAYIDRALPLRNGRALNPPLTTALLINAAAIGPGDKVLVVGAATGYALAVVQSLTADVVAVETDPDLVTLAQTNVPDVRMVGGPLPDGAAEFAPYDAIIIDGAVETVPDTLIAQLGPLGRMTAAISEHGVARLAVGRRGGNGFAFATFVEAEAVPLPGFARPRQFVFAS